MEAAEAVKEVEEVKVELVVGEMVKVAVAVEKEVAAAGRR